jgi:hypothetical protein
MRCFAGRRSGFEALDVRSGHVCSGPAHMAIVHTTVMAFHHGCRRSHAVLPWPTVTGRAGPRSVIWMRRETRDGCDRDGENGRPSSSGLDAAVRLRFGALRLRAPRRGSRRANPPRCLKPLPTSLEAIGRPCRRAENGGFRPRPCGQATRPSRGRAFCRGLLRRSRSQVNPREGLSASSGWLGRTG